MDASVLVKLARRKARLTQRQLAIRSGIPQPTIARIEAGSQAPRFDTVARLMDAAGHVLLPVQTREENVDGVDLPQIREQLRLTPRQRLSQAVAYARMVERARRSMA